MGSGCSGALWPPGAAGTRRLSLAAVAGERGVRGSVRVLGLRARPRQRVSAPHRACGNVRGHPIARNDAERCCQDVYGPRRRRDAVGEASLMSPLTATRHAARRQRACRPHLCGLSRAVGGAPSASYRVAAGAGTSSASCRSPGREPAPLRLLIGACGGSRHTFSSLSAPRAGTVGAARVADASRAARYRSSGHEPARFAAVTSAGHDEGPLLPLWEAGLSSEV